MKRWIGAALVLTLILSVAPVLASDGLPPCASGPLRCGPPSLC